MAKKEVLQQFHKETISRVADRLFQENGLEKTTMNDIAREADYSKATLYVYFKSKDEIFYFIVLKAMKMLLDRIDAGIGASDNALHQYKSICNELTSFSYDYPFYHSSLTETITANAKSREEMPILDEIYQIGELVNAKIEIVFRNGVQQGFFRNDIEILPTGFLYWGTLSSVIQLANSKAEYIWQRMGMDKDAFLEFSFCTLLKAILKEGVDYDEQKIVANSRQP